MSTPSFAVNERVLCYHGPLVYEAKVLKCETWDETNTKLDTVGPHHLVHYKGWKQTCVSDRPAQTVPFRLLILILLLQLGRVGPHGTSPQIQRGQPRPSEGPLPGAGRRHFGQCLCLENLHVGSWRTSRRRAA
jgi:hypothetical protein